MAFGKAIGKRLLFVAEEMVLASSRHYIFIHVMDSSNISFKEGAFFYHNQKGTSSDSV